MSPRNWKTAQNILQTTATRLPHFIWEELFAANEDIYQRKDFEYDIDCDTFDVLDPVSRVVYRDYLLSYQATLTLITSGAYHALEVYPIIPNHLGSLLDPPIRNRRGHHPPLSRRPIINHIHQLKRASNA